MNMREFFQNRVQGVNDDGRFAQDDFEQACARSLIEGLKRKPAFERWRQGSADERAPDRRIRLSWVNSAFPDLPLLFFAAPVGETFSDRDLGGLLRKNEPAKAARAAWSLLRDVSRETRDDRRVPCVFVRYEAKPHPLALFVESPSFRLVEGPAILFAAEEEPTLAATSTTWLLHTLRRL